MILPPRPQERPKFARWRYERSLTLRQTAALIRAEAARLGLPVSCSHEKVRTLCLPLGHAERSWPDLDLAQVIASLTQGAVTFADFPGLRSAA